MCLLPLITSDKTIFEKKLAEERKEKAEYAKKVGQLIMQVDRLKKIWRKGNYKNALLIIAVNSRTFFSECYYSEIRLYNYILFCIEC